MKSEHSRACFHRIPLSLKKNESILRSLAPLIENFSASRLKIKIDSLLFLSNTAAAVTNYSGIESGEGY